MRGRVLWQSHPPKAGTVVVVVLVLVVVLVVVVVVAAAAAGYLTSTAHLTSESLPPAVQEANKHSYKVKYIFNLSPDLSPKTNLLSPTREKTFAK